MKEVLKSRIVSTRLWSELIYRNSFAIVPHVLLSFLSFFICYDMHKAAPSTLISYVIVIGSCVARISLFKLMPKDDLPKLTLKILYYISVFCIGTGWALLYTYVHDFYGHYSARSMFALLQLAGLISAAVSNFAANPISYVFFIIPLTATPIIHMYHHENNEFLITSLCLLFFDSFHIYQIRLSHKFLRNSIEKDLAVTWERDKLQTLINAVPGFVSFIDNDLRYQTINDFGKTHFDERDFIGQRVGFLWPDSGFVKFVTQFMKSDRSQAISEVTIELAKTGSHFIVSIQKIYRPIGGAVIVAIPMDELVEAREKMKEQEAKAIYTSKLVSLGEMAAGIAHEINNPLAIIMGSTDQIIRHVDRQDYSKIRLSADKIHSTIGRISIIIKSLKALARNGEKDPHRLFQFNNILEPCLEVTRERFAGENVQLEVNKPCAELEILGQEIPLAQVMMNLMTNAFDAALDGVNPKWVRLDVIIEEEHVQIRIQDSGKGISVEIRPKIMDPFFTTKAINKGTGLGLSISKSIIEQHGGSLVLDEDAPHTTFVVRLKRTS